VNKKLLIYVISGLLMFNGCELKKRTYDTLYLRLKQDITTLDPAFIVDVDGGMLAAYLYNGLVRLDKQLNVIPDIAKKWEISTDGKTYRFYLRNDVFFSTGEKVTAVDFKKSFERIIDPEVSSPRSWIFDKVKGKDLFMSGKSREVEGFVVVEDHIFEIVLNQPFSPFLSILTIPNAMIVKPDGNHGIQYIPKGTGPFIFNDWQRGNKISLVRNNNYFDGKPNIEKLVIRFIPEDFTAITEFENGNLDVLEIPRSEFEYFTQYDRWKNLVFSTEILNTYYLGFNCEEPPYSNPMFRRAITAGINRDMIIKNFMSSRVTKAGSPVPQILINEGISFTPQHDFDSSYAKSELEKSGVNYKNLTLTLVFNSDKEMEGIAELIQHDLGNMGLTIQLEELEWTTFKEKISTGEAKMFILSWWADYPDIENFLYPTFASVNRGSAGNRVRYKNEKFDTIIEQARTCVDMQTQNKLYCDALNIISNDCPWCCLWHKKKYTVIQPWVKNYFLAPVYNIDKGLEIKLEKRQ